MRATQPPRRARGASRGTGSLPRHGGGASLIIRPFVTVGRRGAHALAAPHARARPCGYKGSRVGEGGADMVVVSGTASMAASPLAPALASFGDAEGEGVTPARLRASYLV